VTRTRPIFHSSRYATLARPMSALGQKRTLGLRHVRFSNRPVWVKRFQTIHQNSFEVAREHTLLFGIGTEALPAWDSKIRWNNLYRGLAVVIGRSKRTCELTSSIVPRGTPYHRLVELQVSSYGI
jgi:superfamily II helicase